MAQIRFDSFQRFPGVFIISWSIQKVIAPSQQGPE